MYKPGDFWQYIAAYSQLKFFFFWPMTGEWLEEFLSDAIDFEASFWPCLEPLVRPST